MLQDWAATRRAPPIGTLSMVRGAANGNVSCCSTSAARASDHVEGPYAATDPASLVRLGRFDFSGSRRRRGRSQIACMSVFSGSVDNVRCISRSAETPSISEWWNLL